MFPTQQTSLIGQKLLIADVTVTIPTQNILVAGLDMLRDGDYYIVSHGYTTATGGDSILAYINGLTGDAYVSQMLCSNGTTVYPNGSTVANILPVVNSLGLGLFTKYSSANAHISMANGFVSGLCNVQRADGYHLMFGWRKTTAVTNVTSILFNMAIYTMGIGTNIKIYKRSA